MLGEVSGTTFSVGHGGDLTIRNTPIASNRLFSTHQFFDGRASNLVDLALKPLFNPTEMGAKDMHSVLSYLEANSSKYGTQFKSEPALERANTLKVKQSLAAFLMTRQVGNTLGQRVLFDRVTASDESRTDIKQYSLNLAGIKRGAALFRGKASCISCHAGPNLSDESFHHTGLAGLDIGVGPGRDLGRLGVTARASDRFAFKTPSLVGIPMSPPYFHNGSGSSLTDVVNKYNAGPANGVANSDPLMSPLGLSSAETKDLVSFLMSLGIK